MMGMIGLTGCNTNDAKAQLQNLKSSPIKASNSSKPQQENNKPFVIHINRSIKQMKVIDKNGIEVMKVPIGIGRGGLKPKQDMMDLVTPTGELVVDLILYQQENFNQVSSQLKDQYLQTEFREFFNEQQGLKKLFKNMNSIDFDGNGKPDQSYGIAYIGLNSAPTHSVVTGPKMRYTDWKGISKTPYWFSIALHGTPRENLDIGAANSGGCIHVQQNVLKELVEKGIVEIGTQVIISDSELVN